MKIEWTPQARRYHRVAAIVVSLATVGSLALNYIYTRSLKIAASGNTEAFGKVVDGESHRLNFIALAFIGCSLATFLFAVRKKRG